MLEATDAMRANDDQIRRQIRRDLENAGRRLAALDHNAGVVAFAADEPEHPLSGIGPFIVGQHRR